MKLRIHPIWLIGACLAVVVGIAALYRRRAEVQYQFVERVRALGGKVYFRDFDKAGHAYSYSSRYALLNRPLFGEGLFVDLYAAPLASFAAIVSIFETHPTSVEILNLSHLPLTDHEIVRLVSIDSFDVSFLWIAGTKISGSCLDKVVAIPHLQSLDISGTDLSGTSLQKLYSAKNLKSLVIDIVDVSDVELRQLQKQLPDCVIQTR